MALKGKSKKSNRHRAKPVARPPRTALEKRSPQRRRIDAFVVIGILFVITMVVAIIWAVLVSTRPEEVAGLDTYATESADPRRELRNISTELADSANQIATAPPGTDLTAAYERVGSLAPRVQTAVSSLTPQMESAGPEFRTAATLIAASGQTLAEAVSVASLGQGSDDPAMAAQLARKAMRLASAAGTLQATGERKIETLQDGTTFEVQTGDVIPWAAPEEQREGAPLNGILPEVPAPPEGGEPQPVTRDEAIDVDLSTVPNSRYTEVVGAALGELDRATGNTGIVVAETSGNGDHSALQIDATRWYDASQTAYESIGAGTGRPETGAVDDIALLGSLWLLQESNRSFASTAADPAHAESLLAAGRNLRLVSDELRRSAVTGFTSVDVLLPDPPETGFDPAAIGVAPAVPDTTGTGASGAVPGPGLPAPGP